METINPDLLVYVAGGLLFLGGLVVYAIINQKKNSRNGRE